MTTFYVIALELKIIHDKRRHCEQSEAIQAKCKKKDIVGALLVRAREKHTVLDFRIQIL